MSERPRPIATSSQTVGPFFHFGLADNATLGCLVRDDTRGERIRLRIGIFDGDGAPVPDALVELWQADADGVYVRPVDPAGVLSPNCFCGFGRLPTGADGTCVFETIRPGQTVPARSKRFDRERSAMRRAVRRRPISTFAFSPEVFSGRSIRASTLQGIRRSLQTPCSPMSPRRGAGLSMRGQAAQASGSSISGFKATTKPCSSISDRHLTCHHA